jgi:hypothetical protein
MTVRLTLPVLLLLMSLATQEPSIRLVPQVVDRHFPALLELQIHQAGDSFAAFPKARGHLRALLRARPRSLTRFPNWAESTPLRSWSLLGTIHYTRARAGRVEAVGNHLCITDSTGVTWWLRPEAVDVWPDTV